METTRLPEGYREEPCPSDPRIVRVLAQGAGTACAFYVRGGDILYQIPQRMYRGERPSIPGFQAVDVAAALGERIQAEAAPGLERYLTENGDNMDIYKTEGFWKRVILCADMEAPYTPALRPLGELDKKPYLTIPGRAATAAQFYPAENVIAYKMGTRLEQDMTPFDFLYGEDWANQIIAQRHQQEGRAPAALAELRRIAVFLQGKHNLRLLFPDGEEVASDKRRSPVWGLVSLLDVRRGRLCVNAGNFCWNDALPAAIFYGRQRLDLDLAALGTADDIMEAPEQEQDTDVLQGLWQPR